MLQNTARAMIRQDIAAYGLMRNGHRMTVEEVRRHLNVNRHKTIGHSGTRAALDRLTDQGVLTNTYQWRGKRLIQHWEVRVRVEGEDIEAAEAAAK